LAWLFLVLEDRIASWQVKRLAKRLLDEAATAEAKRNEEARRKTGSGRLAKLGSVSKGLTRSLNVFTPNRPVSVQPTDGSAATPLSAQAEPVAESAPAATD